MMVSQEILTLVMSESETMVTEWADSRDGHGCDVIEEKISDYLIQKGFSDYDKRKQIKTNVRSFILYDMAIMSW